MIYNNIEDIFIDADFKHGKYWCVSCHDVYYFGDFDLYQITENLFNWLKEFEDTELQESKLQIDSNILKSFNVKNTLDIVIRLRNGKLSKIH